MRYLTAALTVILLVPAPRADAQIPRYELGKRVKRFERTFEKHLSDPATRTLPLPHLQEAVSAFFTLKATKACREIDRATIALLPKGAADASVLAIVVEPERRILSPKDGELRTQIRPMYGERPADEQPIKLQLLDANGTALATSEATTNSEEMVLQLASLTEGDYALRSQIGNHQLTRITQTISVIDNFDARLTALQTAIKSTDPKRTNAVGHSVREWSRQLKYLAKGTKPETDIPAHKLLERLETWHRTGTRKVDASTSRIVLTSDRKAVACRVSLPTAVLNETPRPIVIALHGAGGSENMFYETYGAGKIVELCRERNWILVCPRISSLFGLSLTSDEIMKSLNSLGVTVDRSRVFVVGHSMGAGTAMTLARQKTKLTALAALGGGSSSAISDENTGCSFLVAAGAQDFGRRGATALARGLKKRGAQSRFETYPNTEHLGIVQVALPDVFDFFDAAAKR